MVGRLKDSGLTLVEVLVSASLLLVALGMFGGMLNASQRIQITSSQYSRANDQVQVAFASIDRQIRSGYVVGAGAPPNPADAAVKIYTETYGAPRCVVWVIADSDATGRSGVAQLWVAYWDPTVPGASVPPFSLPPSSGWSRVAGDIWNWLESPQVEPFATTTVGGMLTTLEVKFRLNATERTRASAKVESTFTSRNLPRADEKVGGSTTVKSASC